VGIVALTSFTKPDTRVVTVVTSGSVHTLPQQSQSPAVKLIEVMSLKAPLVVDMALPDKTVLETNSPTLPAAALLLVVVPTTSVVLENARLVALAAPNMGVTSVGELEPTKVPLPVDPLKERFSILLVAIYATVKPALNAYDTAHVVFAVTHTTWILSH
jgi:hypothetical protein